MNHKSMDTRGEAWLMAVGLGMVTAMVAAMVTAGTARADEVRVEVALESVLIPARGYDDNDVVEVVMHGVLPNSCYQIETSEVERLGENLIRLRQFALETNEGRCYDKGTLPPHMKMAVQFTTSARFGRLGKGEYSIEYTSAQNQRASRTFAVEAASTPRIDNQPYAPVTTVATRDFYLLDDVVKVKFSGVMTSDCLELDPDVKAERQGDVIVILPVVRPIAHDPAGQFCEKVYQPFEHTVTLGKLPAGHFLVHVRSMAGNAVNKVFEVLPGAKK